MALNLDVIGKRREDVFTYDQDKVILYALGIGAGVEELDFVYEKALKVFPTFAVLPIAPLIVPIYDEARMNLPTVLHGEQKIVLHGPIPPSGAVRSTGMISSIYDKGDKGAVINLECESRDETGRPLFENHVVIFDRSGGNFGGDRGPKTVRFDPPEGKAPDFRVEYATSPNQAALYRLSGDYNPLHIDPEFAKNGGFDRPVLHGLCTYGFTGRAILHSACGGDPARFKSFSCRFQQVVYPGDTLIVEGWRMEKGIYRIRTMTQDGRVVLGNAVAEVD